MNAKLSTIMQTHQLAIGYEGTAIARDLSLELRAGELTCLLGPNGAGKSTLIRTLAGMQMPLSGHVTLGGRDVRSLHARELAQCLSVVLTAPIQADLMTGYELVTLGRHPYTGWLGRLTQQDHAIVQQAIEAAGAGYLAHRPVGELSDGERQKVMIARALAQEPAVMLLDEPTAFLDLPHRVEVMRTLRSLASGSDCALLLSTHDLDLALRSADRIWLMSADGQVRVGAPEDLVLSGAFEATFARKDVSFDAESGSFTVSRPGEGLVHLTGEGVSAIWTRRALERTGYEVTRNGTPAPIRVDVVGQNGSTLWRCQTAEHTIEVESIHALVEHLQQRA